MTSEERRKNIELCEEWLNRLDGRAIVGLLGRYESANEIALKAMLESCIQLAGQIRMGLDEEKILRAFASAKIRAEDTESDVVDLIQELGAEKPLIEKA